MSLAGQEETEVFQPPTDRHSFGKIYEVSIQKTVGMNYPWFWAFSIENALFLPFGGTFSFSFRELKAHGAWLVGRRISVDLYGPGTVVSFRKKLVREVRELTCSTILTRAIVLAIPPSVFSCVLWTLYSRQSHFSDE
jgi:hypothetical protein